MKKVIYFFGIAYVIIGVVFLTNSFPRITGLSISEEVSQVQTSFTGLFFIFAGFILMTVSKRERKAQAAMEFLLTYGWAILGIIIVIGVLSFSGFLRINPPSQAYLSPPFTIAGINIEEGGPISMDVQNNGVDTKIIEEISIQACGTSTNLNTQILSGTVVNFIIVCTEIITSIISSEVTITYTNPGSSLQQISTGTISGSPSPDVTPPTQSGWSPPDGSNVASLIYLENTELYLNVTFNLNENGRCKWFYSDFPTTQSYATMTEFCTNGAVAVNHLCKVEIPPAPDDFYVYTSCADTLSNEDTLSIQLYYIGN